MSIDSLALELIHIFYIFLGTINYSCANTSVSQMASTMPTLTNISLYNCKYYTNVILLLTTISYRITLFFDTCFLKLAPTLTVGEVPAFKHQVSIIVVIAMTVSTISSTRATTLATGTVR